MPIKRISPGTTLDSDLSLDVFQVQENIEVYDGTLALAVDHLLNHIKVLVSLAYLPGSTDLQQALARHPMLKHMVQNSGHSQVDFNGRSAVRLLLSECQRLLDCVTEIAHLAAWPETAHQAQVELDLLQRDVPFLDFRYDNDPYPSDKDHEEPPLK
jgi:hypothetical protein